MRVIKMNNTGLVREFYDLGPRAWVKSKRNRELENSANLGLRLCKILLYFNPYLSVLGSGVRLTSVILHCVLS